MKAVDKHKIAPVLLKELTIYIIGSYRMQNDLIAYYLTHETGARSFVGEDITHIELLPDTSNDGRPHIGLWDYRGKKLSDILIEIKSFNVRGSMHNHAALFNMPQGSRLEKKCLQNGVRGFFYEEEPLSRFLIGVRSLCEGKSWVSKDIIVKCMTDSENRRNCFTNNNLFLTPRQIDVLALIARGVSNKDIAKKLYISPHTVKTHLYAIFQTIKVDNRLQAAAWAAKYLLHLIQKY